MKIVIFVVILIVIYLIAININITRVIDSECKDASERPPRRKNPIVTRKGETNPNNSYRDDVREPFTFTEQNIIESKFDDSMDKKKNKIVKLRLPDKTQLLMLLKDRFLDNQYTFNVANQPVTTKVLNRMDIDFNNEYNDFLVSNMREWNRVFDSYGGNSFGKHLRLLYINPIFIQSTLNEFVIKVNAEMSYVEEIIVFEATYYGKIETSDDLFDMNKKYTLQLIDLKYIDSVDHIPGPVMAIADKFASFNIDNQMKYVDKINKMHTEVTSRDYQNQKGNKVNRLNN